MDNFKTLPLIFAASAIIMSACSDGNGNGGGGGGSIPPNDSNLGALSCDGVRTWDFGTSDVIDDATSFISESFPVVGLGTTKFPCTVFWEYSASNNCSLAYSYEVYISNFGIADLIRDIGTSGSNVVIVGNDNSRQTGRPANISATDLANFPDCAIE